MSIDRFWILIARKLSGEASMQELRELEALLRLHPHLQFSVEIITNLWQQQPRKDDFELESSYLAHLERMNSTGIVLPPDVNPDETASTYLLHGTRKNRFIRKIAVAASVTVLLFTGLYYYMASGNSPVPAEQVAPLTVTTKNGSRTSMQLPDGSKVWLNSGSTLTYDKEFGKEIREVVLSGEAFFDVVRNVKKPFIIHTINMDIKVLGTQFNVKSYPSDKQSEASLIHGSIEVSLKKRNSEKHLLKPNEKIVVSNDIVEKTTSAVEVKQTRRAVIPEPIFAVQNLKYSDKDSSVIETSWVENKLSFKNESFEDIATKMERWFDIPVEFDDLGLKREHLTGTFTNETIEEALNALQLSTTFRYYKRNNRIVITK